MISKLVGDTVEGAKKCAWFRLIPICFAVSRKWGHCRNNEEAQWYPYGKWKVADREVKNPYLAIRNYEIYRTGLQTHLKTTGCAILFCFNNQEEMEITRAYSAISGEEACKQ